MHARFAGRAGWICLVILCGLLGPTTCEGATPLGEVNVERILFLGNSITLHPPLTERGWKGNWGMAASTFDKDYVHVLTQRIAAHTGTPLQLKLVDPAKKTAEGTTALGDANVVNIAEILERKYREFDPAILRAQTAARPDVVVLQFGENVQMDSFDAAAFTVALRKLVSSLKEQGNPTMFVTSTIYGGKPELDGIKQQIVAEEPARRVFIDLSGFRKEPTYNGFLDHPNDEGMKFIADTIFAAMRSRKPRE